jgi:hypothetical protein
MPSRTSKSSSSPLPPPLVRAPAGQADAPSPLGFGTRAPRRIGVVGGQKYRRRHGRRGGHIRAIHNASHAWRRRKAPERQAFLHNAFDLGLDGHDAGDIHLQGVAQLRGEPPRRGRPLRHHRPQSQRRFARRVGCRTGWRPAARPPDARAAQGRWRASVVSRSRSAEHRQSGSRSNAQQAPRSYAPGAARTSPVTAFGLNTVQPFRPWS